MISVANAGWCAHMEGWSAGGWWAMAIGMVLFWALVVGVVVWLVRSLPWSVHRQGRDTALDVLDRRFAAGEISAEDYRERRSVLRDDDRAPDERNP
jgi:putative membrane protein